VLEGTESDILSVIVLPWPGIQRIFHRHLKMTGICTE